MRTNMRNKGDREMRLHTPEEKPFLDVFLHEATTAPFTGPATSASTRLALSTAISRSWRGLMSKKFPGRASCWGAPPPWRPRCRGPTDHRPSGETRRSGEFGSRDRQKMRSTSGRMPGCEQGMVEIFSPNPTLQQTGHGIESQTSDGPVF